MVNEAGRIMDGEDPAPGLYAAGWIKSGPRGLIGNNKPNSGETVKQLLEDLPHLHPCEAPSNEALKRTLTELGIRVVNFQDWGRIDEAEKERGRVVGKPRERFSRISHMLAVLEQ